MTMLFVTITIFNSVVIQLSVNDVCILSIYVSAYYLDVVIA